MASNRRGFLAGGIAGASALFSASSACAGLLDCCRRRVRYVARCPQREWPRHPCVAGFAWSTCNPLIPDAAAVTTSTSGTPPTHYVSVYGYQLATVGKDHFNQPTIQDGINSSTVNWTVGDSSTWTIDSGTGPNGSDVWTFPATETGSTAGSYGSLNITVAVNPSYMTCPSMTYANLTVKYA
jgi:hypothetical protein